MIEIGKGGRRPVKDYMLTRYACYLIAQNGDPKKEEIAFAQSYFALQTRTLAIHKLTHNIPLSAGDYQELEHILTCELGSKADYQREFGDTPFGLLIRRIAKLDHEAAMQAFSKFINDQSLNQRQIAFVHKIINHMELNGYMENVAELTKPPFDKPVSFIKLFDANTRTALVETINQVRKNAIQITAS